MEQIDVRILDRDYRLAVNEPERERLLEAVRLVDSRMRAIRDSGKIIGLERIAVMVALQLANELLQAPVGDGTTSSGELMKRIRRMSEQVDAEIRRQENLF
jgi:cell division protein ZapA